MTNTWSNETIIDFINKVHLHPELWDVKARIYKDRNAKKDGWNEIAGKFGITSNEAYKKFRSLRTYANNEEKKKKSGSAGGGKVVKWFAFDAISFILNHNTANTGLDSQTNATETTDTDIPVVDPGEVLELEITDSLEALEALDTAQKPRTKKSKTTDPLLEKAQNIICDAGDKKRNEYAAFGEHVANKLSKYDDYTRAQAELKIMQILFECDMMTMYRTRASSTYTQSPHYNSRGGAGTSQSQHSDISTPPLQNEYIDSPDVNHLITTAVRTYAKDNWAHTRTVATFEDVKRAMVKQDQYIVDLRDPKEVASTGMIPSSINIPASYLDSALVMTDADFQRVYKRRKPTKKHDIIFYCRNGQLAAAASNEAVKHGYLSVKTYIGGWEDWKNKIKFDVQQEIKAAKKKIIQTKESDEPSK